MKDYFKKTEQIIDDSLTSIDVNEFERLVIECEETLRDGKKIVVSGLGKNVPVCEKFVGTMNSLGLDACFMNTNSAVHGDIGMIHDKDLVIILTKSGATSESVYLHGLLNKRNCNQWLLTFEKTGILSQKMQNKITVQLRHEGDMWNIVPNNSTTVNLIVLQTLAIELGKRMQITLEQFKENHPGGHIGEMLQNV